MKKSSLVYQYTNKSVEEEYNVPIDDYIQYGGSKSSKWFQSLPSNIVGRYFGKHFKSAIKARHFLNAECLKSGDEGICTFLTSGAGISTAKTCTGIRKVLDNSMMLVAPCDILITIRSTGWMHYTPNEHSITLTSDHPPAQYMSDIEEYNIFKDKGVIKFNLPIAVSSEDSYLYVDPLFHHNRLPLTVVPGAIASEPSKQWSPLSIITLFNKPAPEEVTEIKINKGDVLAYIWFPHPVELKKSKKPLVRKIHDRIVGSYLERGKK